MSEVERIFENFKKEIELEKFIYESLGEKSVKFKDQVSFMTPIVLSAFKALFDFYEVSKSYEKNEFGELSYYFSYSELQTALSSLYLFIITTLLEIDEKNVKEVADFMTALLFGIILKLHLQLHKEGGAT
jgi:hypothetical protein